MNEPLVASGERSEVLMNTRESMVSQHDLIYKTPPRIWQDGFTVDLPKSTPGPVYDIFLTVVTSIDSENPREEAMNNLSRVASTGYNDLHEKHRTWWAGFWNESAVEIEDRFLEGLWYFSLYQLASTCHGETAPGLFGLWNMSKRPQWHGDYHGDYNSCVARPEAS